MTEPGPPLVGLLVALGCGLLIGLERERRKGRGDDRSAAGIRTFTVAAVCGAMAQNLGLPSLVVAGALLVLVLAALAYWKSRSRDPGLTTELALFATYLVGVQAVLSPPLGAACGAGLALLLAARQRLHRLATQWLSTEEWHDALMLAALGLVVLPLVPNVPQPWLGGINLRPLAAMGVVDPASPGHRSRGAAGGRAALRADRIGFRLGLRVEHRDRRFAGAPDTQRTRTGRRAGGCGGLFERGDMAAGAGDRGSAVAERSTCDRSAGGRRPVVHPPPSASRCC